MNDTLGGRIVSARETAGLTTAQLARRLGVKSATLQNWESDRSEPRSNKLFMLAGLLNVSPTWLINGLGESPGETLPARTEVTIAREQLVELRGQIEKLTGSIDQVLARLDGA
ncbi:MAG: helix-turn-helix domain-containing protein [Roseitalea sp.]|nr:helix-turn-helix domain-containing protein [Roseitalea sp.]MBO6722003.1 helix-turn-helix domain-containing protein [Roseitalea sp.]MBO6743441.1 helix-turn-helix domain-containing protein [Roseitalea sp.]